MQQRILVTGGAGFIGCNFVRHALGHTDVAVTVLDGLTYSASPAALDGLAEPWLGLVVGDVADATVVDPLVADHDAVRDDCVNRGPGARRDEGATRSGNSAQLTSTRP